jgi:hypothetical protein
MISNKNKWTEKEIDILYDDAEKGIEYLESVLNRSRSAIFSKASSKYIQIRKRRYKVTPRVPKASRSDVFNEIASGGTIKSVTKSSGYLSIDNAFKVEVHNERLVDPRMYWQNEKELEESFNPKYDYKSLSPSEKEIYNAIQ